MDRRSFLAAGTSAFAALACAPRASSQQTLADQYRQSADAAARDFPFALVTVPGAEALATFNRIRAEGRGSPVILGGDEGLSRTYDELKLPAFGGPTESTSQTLATAKGLIHPRDLELRASEDRRKAAAYIAGTIKSFPDDRLPTMEVDGRQLTPAEVRAKMEADLLATPQAPALGDWPVKGDRLEPLGMLIDYQTRKLPDRIHIATIPTTDWTEIPAHLRWGGWNACPQPEYHVAAFRSWRDRYGAELLTMAGDIVELRVSRRPKSRDEALALAKELYVYNNDLIDQGYGDLAPLAASLMESDVWAFWWD